MMPLSLLKAFRNILNAELRQRLAAIAAMKELIGPDSRYYFSTDGGICSRRIYARINGAMYAQFALVIAATAFISAINAMTLKPTQCALWLKAN